MPSASTMYSSIVSGTTPLVPVAPVVGVGVVGLVVVTATPDEQDEQDEKGDEASQRHEAPAHVDVHFHLSPQANKGSFPATSLFPAGNL